MCGSLTCLCFRYSFFDEKLGEYESIAVAHHQDTALLQAGPWEKSITNRRSYVLKPSYQLPFFLRGFFCTFFYLFVSSHPTVHIHPILLFSCLF